MHQGLSVQEGLGSWGAGGWVGDFTYLGCKPWGLTSLGTGGELQGPTLWLRTVYMGFLRMELTVVFGVILRGTVPRNGLSENNRSKAPSQPRTCMSY